MSSGDDEIEAAHGARAELRPATLDQAWAQITEQRALLDALPFATGLRDGSGRILYANSAAAAGYGVAVEVMLDGNERDLLPPGNDVEDVLAKDREVLDSGRSLTVPGQRFRTRDGRLQVLHMTRERVRFRGAPAVLVTALDVTDVRAAAAERRKLERRVAESQRLEGLGLLAGGIAHDFNNLLVGVLGNAELALAELTEDSRAHGFIERVRLAAERLAGLARQMLAYSGRGHVRMQPIDLAPLIREVLQLSASSVPSGIRVTVSLPDKLPAVDGDPAQLSQVIMNLVINAAEAIGASKGTGTVEVIARSEFLDSDRCANLAVRSIRGAMDYLCLEVRDDGPGMDDATRERIFDPFFSTKGLRGRGLGLASVIGIVRAHQGALHVDSQLGVGTSMRVWLPLARERARLRGSEAPAASKLVAGLRVLVVDEEVIVRETTRAILEARGLEVLAEASGQAAIEAAKRAGQVDAVLLDVDMPAQIVRDTHSALRALLPDTAIVLTSGHGESELLSSLRREPATHFLEKPFSAKQLVARLQTLVR
jgi:two-component system, cell cycle sensor histidine kinase and response regulator CckA